MASANFPHQLRSALFVDFDNIYINLANQDPSIANQFASNPERWLDWLERELPTAYLGLDGQISGRRILIRRCYLNPVGFAAFRPYFIRSAFEVVDCPPLTGRGKTSTDIHVVMDILDALQGPTHFDEFIILSGDADFTPVLLRLRKHDRQTVLLAAGYAAPAYKASCDYIISQEDFICSALGVLAAEDEPAAPREMRSVPAPLLTRMAGRLREATTAGASAGGGIEASELPAVYKEFSEFRQSDHWLGFGSLRRLTEALVAQCSELMILDSDPWCVTVRADPPAAGAEAVSPAPAPHDLPPESTLAAMKLDIAHCIQEVVRGAQAPVTMAHLADTVTHQFGQGLLSTGWLGAGSFKNLLATLDLDGLRVSAVIPGYVLDPQRHELPASIRRLDQFALERPELAGLAQKVHRLTDVPYLMPAHYALLFQELARAINEQGYQMSRISKTVRDRCVERGAPVSRSHIDFVLIGIGFTGYQLGAEPPEAPGRLAEAFLTNIVNLCGRAQWTLSEEEMAMVREWVSGEVA